MLYLKQMIEAESSGLTPREWQTMEYDKDASQRAYEHDIEKSKLQIQMQLAVNDAEIALRKLEARWGSWLSIPKYVIKLPVLILFGFAYIAHAVKGTKPSKEFWDFLKR